MAAKAPGRLLACSLLLALALAPLVYAHLEGLDEPEPSRPAPASYETLKTDEALAQPSVKKPAPKQPAKQQAAIKPPKLGMYEAFAGVFLVTYLLNVLWGRARNATIAAAWSKAFTEPGGVFDKNFSSLSAGQSNTLMREAGNCFKFYASGRRHVQGLLATLNLRARQDILSLVWYIVTPTEDTVTLEAYMSEASMPAIVLAVGTPRPLRRLAADQLDVLKYTKKIQAPKESTPGWPNDKLIIHAEHSNIFGEIFSDPRVLQTLNPTGPHAKAFKYFRTLHFTNDAMDGSHKRVLRFTFALPRPGNMQDLAPLMALVPLFIDLVGSYKLSPELKKKAEAARSKTEADTEAETRKQRLDALAQRKQEKLLEEKAKLARLPPAERQKAEDKLRKTQMEKQMKKRTKTM